MSEQTPLNTNTPAATLTPIGTYIPVSVPVGIAEVQRDGVFVDRRNGSPMEMDAYSIYLALKSLEIAENISLAGDKSSVVKTIEERRRACGGFWHHGAWTASSEEVHYRFTAAAIKLLIEAHVDGLYPDAPGLLAILKQHLSYREQLDFGPWFLHDSLELPDVSLPPLPDLRANRVWGSSPRCELVLNTHVDTLTTALYALENLPIEPSERATLTELVDRSIATLFFVLDRPTGAASRFFMEVDSAARALVFRLDTRRGRLSNWVKWRIFDTYFPIRRWLRSKLSFFVFSDGYVERDISQIGYHFDYHVYNVHDLARFALLAERLGFLDEARRQTLLRIIDDGIDHMSSPGYRSWIEKSISQNGRAALVCETILARAALTPNFVVPDAWRCLFLSIWGRVAATPALLGFDPFVLHRRHDGEGEAVFELANGDTFSVPRSPAPQEATR